MTSRSLAAAFALTLALAAPAAGQDTLAYRAPVPIAPPPRRPATELPRTDSLAVYHAVLGRWLDSTLATVQARRKIVYLPPTWSTLGRPALDSIAKRAGVRICTTRGTRGCPERHYRELGINELRVRNIDSVTVTYGLESNNAGSAVGPCLPCDPDVVARMLELGMNPGPVPFYDGVLYIATVQYLAIVRDGGQWTIAQAWREWEP